MEEIFKVRREKLEDGVMGAYIITIGDQIASGKSFETEEQAQDYINSKPWELIAVLITGIVNIMKKQENEKEHNTD